MSHVKISIIFKVSRKFFKEFKQDPFKKISSATEELSAKFITVFEVGLAGGVVAAAAAVAGLVAYFKELMENNEAFREKVDEIWSIILEVFEPVTEHLPPLKKSFSVPTMK